jgi:hypothetical protein
MRHWTSALVAAITGLVAANGASAQQHVLNMLVLSEDAPKVQKVADAYQAELSSLSSWRPRHGLVVALLSQPRDLIWAVTTPDRLRLRLAMN